MGASWGRAPNKVLAWHIWGIMNIIVRMCGDFGRPKGTKYQSTGEAVRGGGRGSIVGPCSESTVPVGRAVGLCRKLADFHCVVVCNEVTIIINDIDPCTSMSGTKIRMYTFFLFYNESNHPITTRVHSRWAA